jgi:Clp amino terminal domain, pathogenicity island component
MRISASKKYCELVEVMHSKPFAGYDARVLLGYRAAVGVLALALLIVSVRLRLFVRPRRQLPPVEAAKGPQRLTLPENSVASCAAEPEQHGHRFGAPVPPPASVSSLERWRCADSFTESGRRIIANAHLQAYAHRSDHVGTEHVLLALINADNETVADALRDAGLVPDDVRRRVEEEIGSAQEPRAAHLPYSPHAKRAFSASQRAAQSQDENLIDAAHILYGLLSQRDSAAARFVSDLGVDPNAICRHVSPNATSDTGPRAEDANSSVRKCKAV